MTAVVLVAAVAVVLKVFVVAVAVAAVALEPMQIAEQRIGWLAWAYEPGTAWFVGKLEQKQGIC